jgi:hypothetical protein
VGGRGVPAGGRGDGPEEADHHGTLDRGLPRLPSLDALREGYEVFPVVDAVGGTSPEAPGAGLERIVQAGGQPIGRVSLACELQRDWARTDTVPAVVDIVLTSRLQKGV